MENATAQANHSVDSVASTLLAQMVKNVPAMQETRVPSLGQEDPLEKGMATQYSCLENSMGKRSLAGYSPCGSKELDMTEQISLSLS